MAGRSGARTAGAADGRQTNREGRPAGERHATKGAIILMPCQGLRQSNKKQPAYRELAGRLEALACRGTALPGRQAGAQGAATRPPVWGCPDCSPPAGAQHPQRLRQGSAQAPWGAASWAQRPWRRHPAARRVGNRYRLGSWCALVIAASYSRLSLSLWRQLTSKVRVAASARAPAARLQCCRPRAWAAEGDGTSGESPGLAGAIAAIAINTNEMMGCS